MDAASWARRAALATDDVCELNAYFSEPVVEQAALAVERVIEQRSGGAALLYHSEARDLLRLALLGQRAWIYAAAVGRAATAFESWYGVPRWGLVYWFYGAAPDESAALASRIPHTLAFVLPELLVASITTKRAAVLEVLLEAPIFTTFLSEEARQRILAAAATYLGTHGTVKTIDVLLAHGVDVNGYGDCLGFSMVPQERPIASRDLQYLVDQGVFTVGSSSVLRRVLQCDAAAISEPRLVELLRLGLDANAVDEPTIHAALKKHSADVLLALYHEGCADIDVRDDSGNTALAVNALSHATERNANTAMFKLLLRLGADPDTRGPDGAVLLGAAPSCLVPILLRADADPNARDGEGKTPLHLVRARGLEMFPVAKTLIHHGADLQARDNRGRTPLHAVVADLMLLGILEETLRLFLEHGADPTAADNDGRTPVQVWMARPVAKTNMGAELTALLASSRLVVAMSPPAAAAENDALASAEAGVAVRDASTTGRRRRQAGSHGKCVVM